MSGIERKLIFYRELKQSEPGQFFQGRFRKMSADKSAFEISDIGKAAL